MGNTSTKSRAPGPRERKITGAQIGRDKWRSRSSGKIPKNTGADHGRKPMAWALGGKRNDNRTRAAHHHHGKGKGSPGPAMRLDQKKKKERRMCKNSVNPECTMTETHRRARKRSEKRKGEKKRILRYLRRGLAGDHHDHAWKGGRNPIKIHQQRV